MAADTEVALQRVRDALVRKFMEQIELQPVEPLSSKTSDFEPCGWELYCVHWGGRCSIGGEEYLAYHPGLDDVILLGMLGE